MYALTEQPLEVWITDDIEAVHRRLVRDGATAMLKIGDELIAERDGIPLAGIRDVPAGRVAVLEDSDGRLLGLWEESDGSSSSKTPQVASR
jgi:hypothetical protein